MFSHNNFGINDFGGGFDTLNLRLIFPGVSQVAAAAPSMGSVCKAGAEGREEMVPIPYLPAHQIESFPRKSHQTFT